MLPAHEDVGHSALARQLEQCLLDGGPVRPLVQLDRGILYAERREECLGALTEPFGGRSYVTRM